MRINGFRCDGCGKEHLLEPTLIVQNYREILPAEWFMVSQGPKADQPWDQKEPWLFCSKGCLRSWLTTQITANDIALPSQEDKS